MHYVHSEVILPGVCANHRLIFCSTSFRCSQTPNFIGNLCFQLTSLKQCGYSNIVIGPGNEEKRCTSFRTLTLTTHKEGKV
jgi:hypothetical protein